MNADTAVELLLAAAAIPLAVALLVTAFVVGAHRGSAIVRIALSNSFAKSLGIAVIAGGTIAMTPGATASVSDPPATLTLDDSVPVTTPPLSSSNTVTETPAPTPTRESGAGAIEPPVTPATYTVEPGDNFWSIASRVVGRSWSPVPPPSAVGRYWLDLIAANAARLVEPGHPNLIVAGQVLVIPEP